MTSGINFVLFLRIRERSLGRQCPFRWCVCVCGVEDGLEDGLGGHSQASDFALAKKISVTLILHDHLHYCEIFLARS